MKKILVIGCPGSGKSIFSRALQQRTGLPLHHLDLLYWNPDKTHLTHETFLAKLSSILAEDHWIIDGNYKRSLDLRLQHCNAVIFLDYSLESCLEGIASRKGKARPDMPWIEDENDYAELRAFVQSFHRSERQAVIDLLKSYPGIHLITFYNHEEAACYLETL